MDMNRGGGAQGSLSFSKYSGREKDEQPTIPKWQGSNSLTSIAERPLGADCFTRGTNKKETDERLRAHTASPERSGKCDWGQQNLH